jgi:hypothetical protein
VSDKLLAEERKEERKKERKNNNNKNKKRSKHNKSPKLCLGDINIKSVLVLVNHHFLTLSGKKSLMSGQNFFSQQIFFFFSQRH